MTSVFGNRALFLLIGSESHGAMYSRMRESEDGLI